MRKKKVKFTESQYAEMQTRYLAGESAASIAALFNTSDVVVRLILRRRGVTMMHGQKPVSDGAKRNILGLFQKGLTTRAISDSTGISNGEVSKIIRAFGVAKRTSTKRRKLDPETRDLVAKKYVEERATYHDLGTEYGVTGIVIKRILKEHGIAPRTGWTKYRTVEWTDRKERIHIFKSTWERAFAEYLDKLGLDWTYEPQKWPLKTCRCYTPDFVISQGEQIVHLVEIHGWLDDKTLNRLTEFRESYPDLSFQLLGPAELAKLGLIESEWQNHHQAVSVSQAAATLNNVLFELS